MPDPVLEAPKQPLEGDLIDQWKASVSTKKFMWFVGKASVGIAAAPLALAHLHNLGLILEPGSVLAALVPKMLPAILGGLLHVSQDAAALKTGAKWL